MGNHLLELSFIQFYDYIDMIFGNGEMNKSKMQSNSFKLSSDAMKRKCTVLTDHTQKAPKNTKKRTHAVAFDISQSVSFGKT